MSTSRRLILFAAVQILAIAALAWGWTVYWSSAAGRIEAEFDATVAAQKAKGVDVACASRRLSGYPIRFHFICDGLTVSSRGRERRIDVSIASVSATALAFTPGHQRVVVTGAVKLAIDRVRGDADPQAPDRVAVHLSSGELGLDVRLNGEGLEALSLDAGAVGATIAAFRGDAEVLTSKIKAERIEAAATPASKGDLSIKVAITSPSHQTDPSPGAMFKDARIARAGLAARLHQPAALKGKTMDDRFRSWQRAGGAITVERIVIDGTPVSLEGRGRLKAEAGGHLGGKIASIAGGLEPVLQSAVDAGELEAENAVPILTAANLLSQKDTAEGDVALPFTFNAKGVYYGPLRLVDPVRLFMP